MTKDSMNHTKSNMDYSRKFDLYGDGIGAVEYVQHMGDDLTIVNAARISFNKQKTELDEKDLKLIKYLAEHKHTSTFEHNVITLKFTVPLFVRSQHHRHRTASYNEISNRYLDRTDPRHKMQFYEPAHFRTQHATNRQASNADDLINPLVSVDNDYFEKASDAYRRHNVECAKLYQTLLESGVCKEQARAVLPQSLYTSYIATMSLRNALHFCSLRMHEGAQWEIQKVAEAVYEIIRELWPAAVESYLSPTSLSST
jgi:thymidylate synthase (FAD)